MKAETRPRPPKRILDFDIETRRIGFFDAGRFAPTGCEPVAVAWHWHGSRVPVTFTSMGTEWTLARYSDLLRPIITALGEADLVTGHYIRKFDLPILAGACFELGWKMPSVLTHDTKDDLIAGAGFSKSQENLSAMKRLDAEKFHMNDNDWRSVARLTQEGMSEAVTRVSEDVRQHEKLYNRFIEEGVLREPQLWTP